MELKTNQQYDEIIALLMQNVLAESNRAGGQVVLWDFQPSNAIDRVYYHAACNIADIYDKQIYLEMKLWDYLKFKYKNRQRKNLHWVSRKHTNIPAAARTSVYIIVDHVRNYLDIPLSIFDDILKEYYGE